MSDTATTRTTHPYLARKAIDLAALREACPAVSIELRSTRIKRYDGDGSELEPWSGTAVFRGLVDAAGADAGAERILPERIVRRPDAKPSDKFTTPGSKVSGTFTPIGFEPAELLTITGTLYVCAGLADGWSIHEATGCNVACCVGENSIPGLVSTLRTVAPHVELIAAVDNDEAGHRAGRKTGIAWACPGELKDWSDVRQQAGPQAVREQLTVTRQPEPEEAPKATSALEGLALIDGEVSEDALALVFERQHERDLRYCHTAGAWYCWDGTRWKRDRRQLAFNYAREICRDFGGGAVKFSKAAVASAVERFACSAPALAADSEVWDQSPWLLGTPGGVVELETGTLREARHDDYITRTTTIAPEAGEPTRWLAFLRDATRDDAGLIRFLQQVAGYCLTGSTREHALFFIYGAGGNGKSVFLNTLTGIIGEYSATAAMDAFTASKHDKHPTDLAMLQGARLVTASETEDGRAWAEAKIKQMTGGDPITARFMRRDFFTYQPEFKLVIVGNHKPELRNVDDATRRRFNIIPFIHRPTTPDPNLEQALRDEWPRILSWAIAGALDWQQNGLIRPEVVADATREYFEEQDLFGQWLEDRCEFDPNYRETSASLFGSWRAYAAANAYEEGSATSFSAALKKRGFEKYRSKRERGFRGLRIRPITAPAAPDDDRCPW